MKTVEKSVIRGIQAIALDLAPGGLGMCLVYHEPVGPICMAVGGFMIGMAITRRDTRKQR